MGAVGPTQLLLIALVILLLFGGRKIPELMRGLGQGMKEFKDASSGKEDKTDGSDTVSYTHLTLPTMIRV